MHFVAIQDGHTSLILKFAVDVSAEMSIDAAKPLPLDSPSHSCWHAETKRQSIIARKAGLGLLDYLKVNANPLNQWTILNWESKIFENRHVQYQRPSWWQCILAFSKTSNAKHVPMPARHLRLVLRFGRLGRLQLLCGTFVQLSIHHFARSHRSQAQHTLWSKMRYTETSGCEKYSLKSSEISEINA